jgi:hypothetical protein
MRARRVIVLLLACASLGVFLPAAPAGAQLPPVWCNPDYRYRPQIWCVGFDGINVTAGVGHPYDQGFSYPLGEMRVELVWYDWEQNHKRLYDPPGQAQILNHSYRTSHFDPDDRLTTSAVSWRPGVYCAREVVWYYNGDVRWADRVCRSTNND